MPVSSGRVHKETDIEAGPATIRHIMGELDENGFLEQPHVSGGRVPTDKAYRYFVNYLMRIEESGGADKTVKEINGGDSFEEMNPVRNPCGEWRSSHELLSVITRAAEQWGIISNGMNKTISEATKLFTIMADFGRKKQLNFYGVQRLLDEPEFADGELLYNFAGLFDNLYEIADIYRRRINEETIFIGKENPLKETRMMSVVGGKIKNREKNAVLLIIGPRRMNYEYNCSILRYFFEK